MIEQQDTETAPTWYGIDAETGERFFAPPSLDPAPDA
jgi:hypothetical protein